MKKSRLIVLGVAFGIAQLFAAAPSSAAPFVLIGSSAATTVDRSATFSTVVDGTDLTAYTEGGLNITIPQIAYEDYDPTGGNGGFNGPFFYPRAGSYAFASISTSDSASLLGLGFNVGTGYTQSLAVYGGTNIEDIAYRMIRGGFVISEGTLAVAPGTLLGFGDSAGFDQLLIGAYANAADASGALLDDSSAQLNAIAIDNLEAQLGEGAVIPEPTTIALLGFGLIGAVRARRNRSHQR